MSDNTDEKELLEAYGKYCLVSSECILREDLDFGDSLGDIVIPRLLTGQSVIVWKDSVAILTLNHYGCYGIDWLQYMGERFIDTNTNKQGLWEGLFVQYETDKQRLARNLGYGGKEWWEYLDDATPQEMFGALYEYWSDGDGQRQHKVIRLVEDNRGW